MRTLDELANVKMGDMTPAERRAVLKAVCAKLKRELEAPAMQQAMQSAIERHAP